MAEAQRAQPVADVVARPLDDGGHPVPGVGGVGAAGGPAVAADGEDALGAEVGAQIGAAGRPVVRGLEHELVHQQQPRVEGLHAEAKLALQARAGADVEVIDGLALLEGPQEQPSVEALHRRRDAVEQGARGLPVVGHLGAAAVLAGEAVPALVAEPDGAVGPQAHDRV
ncbi:MAG: hypothetical protein ACK559_37715, partial [bacterium]